MCSCRYCPKATCLMSRYLWFKNVSRRQAALAESLRDKYTPVRKNRGVNSSVRVSYFRDSSTATATLTVMPTMGLLPAPRKPIISTSNPTFGGVCIGTQRLFQQETRYFTKQEAHRLKA